MHKELAMHDRTLQNLYQQMRKIATLRYVLWFLVLLFAQTAQGQTVNSPTGSTPKLFWTSQRQIVWNRMVSENHPYWQYLKSKADASPFPGDIGDYATMAYQMTGNLIYARSAWSCIQPYATSLTIPGNWGRNETREEFMTYVMIYDWIRPALTPAERTTFINWLNYMGDLVLNKIVGVPWGTRTSDSDETLGHYFGLAFLDLATTPDNPRAGTFLTSTWADGDGSGIKSVGGLISTGINRNTMRNAVGQFMSIAKGGVWIESSEYSLDTLKLILMGAEGVRTATGADYFPEFTALIPDMALAHLYKMTPDGNQNYQWGDDEHPRDLWIQHHVTLTAMFAGLTQGNAQVGPYLHELTEELAHKPNEAGYGLRPYSRFFLFYNPYAPIADWRSAGLPKGLYASGQGFVYFHDGWGSNDSFLGAHMSAPTLVDHETETFGDFQLFRHGEWAFTHPIGYGPETIAYGPPSTNGMQFAGLNIMAEARGPIAQEFGPNGEYTYLAGSTGGAFVWEGYWNPPSPFLQEWTRSLLYLPGQDKHSDTVIIYDRTNSQNPLNLTGGVTRYYIDVANAITAAPALKQWVFHMPVRPTLTPQSISWVSPGGQNASISTLLPVNQNRFVYDESLLDIWTVAAEKKWQVRIVPTTEQQWDTFLNVAQVYDTGVICNNSVVRSTSGEAAEGTLVQRSNHKDVLALFGAAQGPVIPPTPLKDATYCAYNPKMINLIAACGVLHSGYTVSWTSATNGTDLYLLNLDPSKQWSANVDGSAAVSVNVSSQGVGRMSVPGTGAHQLQLRSNTSGPLAPTNLTTTAGNQQVSLAWTISAGATSYNVKRATTPGGPYTTIASGVATANYTDKPLTNGTTYYYVVTASNAVGESGNSNEASGTPTAGAANSATFVKTDTTTQGNWKGVYGSQGYNVIGDTTNYPAYAVVTPNGTQSFTWAASTPDARALIKANASDHIASCWYKDGTFTIDVNLTDGNTHQVALQLLDWEKANRAERIDILDAGSNAVLDTQNASGFAAGSQYLVWNLRGHVLIKFTRTAGSNAVLSGLFFN
jgi:hypothetical protein